MVNYHKLNEYFSANIMCVYVYVCVCIVCVCVHVRVRVSVRSACECAYFAVQLTTENNPLPVKKSPFSIFAHS